MALGSLNLIVTKQDFVDRINVLEQRMQSLQDVIQRYGEAKKNLDQFIIEGDSNYYAMVERIDTNIMAAKNSFAALQEMKQTLEKTVQTMEGMSTQISSTIKEATEAATSTIKAAINVQSVL